MLVYLKPLQRYCIFLICANIFTTNRVFGGILIQCLAGKRKVKIYSKREVCKMLPACGGFKKKSFRLNLFQFLSHNSVGLAVAEDKELTIAEMFVISMYVSDAYVIT